MFLLRICLMALRALQANLLRSLLATLGVIIGVAAVISAMSILEGATHKIMDSLQTFGSDQIFVTPATVRAGGRAVRNTETLTIEDAEALAAAGGAILRAAPEVQTFETVKHGNENRQYQMLGTNEQYTHINRYHVERGEFISATDVMGENKVVVLGHKVAKDLFGNADPLGFTVKIKGIGFRVIGVMEKKGNLGFRNVDNQVIIPVSTAMRRVLGVRTVTDLVVQATSPEMMAKAQEDIKKVLRQRHRIQVGQENDFELLTQEQIRQQVDQTVKVLAVVLYSIAGISLVVGGIGITNIMLVSVTERTREIGVRMAVGAQRWDILRQFLIEASTISLLGGLFGILLGMGFNTLIERVTQVFQTYTPPKVIIIAVSMAVMTGVFSGLYPAYKASRLDPVEALRYE